VVRDRLRQPAIVNHSQQIDNRQNQQSTVAVSNRQSPKSAIVNRRQQSTIAKISNRQSTIGNS